MAVHKYIFLEKEEGLYTYKVKQNEEFEMKFYHGEDCFKEKDMNKFFHWLNKIAAIGEDDLIDFCFLMKDENSIDFSFLMSKEKSHVEKEEMNQKKSTWTSGGIIHFLKQVCPKQNFCLKHKEYSIQVEQDAGIFAPENEVLYIMCLPAFEYSIEKGRASSEKTHFTYRRNMIVTEDDEECSVLYLNAMEYLKNI